MKFSQILETSVIETVENGFMTKDLAICIYDDTNVAKDKYLNTEKFIDKIVETLEKNLLQQLLKSHAKF